MQATPIRTRPLNGSIFVILCMILNVLPVAASEWEDADLRNGEDINELCAGCHGEFGQGGKEGEYPRLAGQPPGFISRQMHLFRDRKRPNMAMLEYVDERQAPDEDIRDISAYLAQIELTTKLPPIDKESEFDAFERVQLAMRVHNIPRYPGDVEAGRKLYKMECRSCHGTDGWGKASKNVPMLAGQYTNYLKRQVEKYRKGIRIHDPEDPEYRLLNEISDADLENIYAYLSIVDD